MRFSPYLNDPVTKDVAFGDPAARGRFFVSLYKGVVFMQRTCRSLTRGGRSKGG